MNNPLNVFGWDYVVSTNRDLCHKSGYQHGITSEGYETAKAIFDEAASRPKLEMAEVTETLRILHKTAPFLFLNGNSFADIGKTMLSMVLENHSSKIRSIVGHHIAGTEILDKDQLAKAFEEEANKSRD